MENEENDIINYNPYRVLGVLAGTDRRTLEWASNRLKRYVGSELEPEDDYSFPDLSFFYRNRQIVDEALERLRFDKDRLFAALFWFYIDETNANEAFFDRLKRGELSAAVEIGFNLLKHDSSFEDYVITHNLAVLHIFLAMEAREREKAFLHIKTAVTIGLQVLESEFVHKFVTAVTSRTFKISKTDIKLMYLKGMEIVIPKAHVYYDEYRYLIQSLEFEGKDSYFNDCTDRVFANIERKINKAREQHKNIDNVITAGNELCGGGIICLQGLEEALGKEDERYRAACDKVATEILECAVVYFVHYTRQGIVPPDESVLRLIDRAGSIAVGREAIQRIEENKRNARAWMGNRPQQKKPNLLEPPQAVADKIQVISYMQIVSDAFDLFQSQPPTIKNARQLLNRCRPLLLYINSTGEDSEEYYELSARMGQAVFSCIIQEVDAVLAIRHEGSVLKTLIKRSKLQSVLYRGVPAMELLGAVNMDSDLKERYESAKDSYKKMIGRVKLVVPMTDNNVVGRMVKSVVGSLLFFALVVGVVKWVREQDTDRIAFEKIDTSDASYEVYEQFAKEHPDNKYIEKVYDRMYEKAIVERGLFVMDRFATDYAHTEQGKRARQYLDYWCGLLYDSAKEKDTREAWEIYKQRVPVSEYRDVEERLSAFNKEDGGLLREMWDEIKADGNEELPAAAKDKSGEAQPHNEIPAEYIDLWNAAEAIQKETSTSIKDPWSDMEAIEKRILLYSDK